VTGERTKSFDGISYAVLGVVTISSWHEIARISANREIRWAGLES
jgi:hypothetical protein